jgi:excinuclease UvrABC ATPase subunit
MPQEYIELRGARENNLKNVSLRISKAKSPSLQVFVIPQAVVKVDK